MLEPTEVPAIVPKVVVKYHDNFLLKKWEMVRSEKIYLGYGDSEQFLCLNTFLYWKS